MNSREAISKLIKNGWVLVRTGKGDHVILRKDARTVILSNGKTELSSGITAKVRSWLNK